MRGSSAQIRYARREQGQSTVLIVCLLGVFVLLMAMVVNVSQAVNRRVAVQIVADAGAWTGASSMAVGMNKLAEINKWIQTFWGGLTIALNGFTVTECELGDTAVDIYDGARTVLGIAYYVMNIGWAQMPRLQATKVSENNIYDLFPGEDWRAFDLAEEDDEPDARIARARMQTMLVLSEQVPDNTEPEPYWGIKWVFGTGSRRQASWVCVTASPPWVEGRSHSFDVWFKKSLPGVQYFVWRVKAPATQAILFDQFFGPNAIPEMKAVGVAKAVVGNIEKGEQTYVAKMVPASNVIGKSLFDGGGLFSEPTVHDEYRDVDRQVTH